MKKVYYLIRPLIPRRVQLWLRRQLLLSKIDSYREVWPILEKAGDQPPAWPGWPQGKKFAVILTHDVEKQIGHDRCARLAQLEQELGFCSSFNFVPERYNVSESLRYELQQKGFEVGVHGLNHDGKLYQSQKVFETRAKKINQYIKEWGVVGFRSPAMHHNLEWIKQLNILYDLSTFDTDPFEPQPDGAETIFPFWVPGDEHNSGYVEMPYTIAQDFTPLVLLREPTIETWTKKVDWIVQKGGMVLVNTHPDYMCFEGKPRVEEFPVHMYADLLRYISEKYADQYWHALPKEAAQYYKSEVLGSETAV